MSKTIIKTPEDGKSFFDNLETKDYPVTVSLSQNTRSLSQNALLWNWNTQIAQWLQKKGDDYKDWDSEKVHEMHKHTFLGWHQKTYTDFKTGDSFKCHVLNSTTTLDKGEMQTFMDKIYYFWADKKLFLVVPQLSEYFKNLD